MNPTISIAIIVKNAEKTFDRQDEAKKREITFSEMIRRIIDDKYEKMGQNEIKKMVSDAQI